MVGENSLEGLLFAMPEVGDPNILASYDWNSGFGVGIYKFSPQKTACHTRWAQFSLTPWTWTSACSPPAFQAGPRRLVWNSLDKPLTLKTSLLTFTCLETQSLGWLSFYHHLKLKLPKLLPAPYNFLTTIHIWIDTQSVILRSQEVYSWRIHWVLIGYYPISHPPTNWRFKVGPP